MPAHSPRLCGDSGQGITHGVVASLLLSGLIVDGRHPWADIYDPARKPVRAAGTFISENLTAVKNFAEYVAPGELKSVDGAVRWSSSAMPEQVVLRYSIIEPECIEQASLPPPSS